MIGHHILSHSLTSLLRELDYDYIFILCDLKVHSLYRELLTPTLEYTIGERIYLIQGDEEHKNIQELAGIWQWLTEAGASRRSILITIGGGSITDLGGFAASTYMRGIRSVNIPTTLLGMVDASIGGKTAIDFAGVKNIIGAFHSPIASIIEVEFLSSLPKEELLAGYAEVIKHALLMGQDSWEYIRSIEDPTTLAPEEWIQIIRKQVTYKNYIVEQDPTEQGLRAILNLGHTVGHALEAMSKIGHRYQPLSHGYAVAIGLQVEIYLYCMLTGANTKIMYELRRYCRKLYPHYQYACKDYPQMLTLMQRDKKSSGGIIRFVGLSEPGEVELVELTDTKKMEDALDFYRETFAE